VSNTNFQQYCISYESVLIVEETTDMSKVTDMCLSHINIRITRY